MDEKHLDQELNTSLQELRVKLPGVQILFAFLLVIPFSEGFVKTTATQKGAYLADLLFTALASIFLIAPAVYHRIHFRCGADDKDRMLRVMNKLAIAGGVFLSLAMVTSIFLVTDYLFGRPASIAVAAGLAVACVAAWYALPLLHKTGHPPRVSASRARASSSST